MRQYLEGNKRSLKYIVCNQCGREMKLENGIVQEGVYSGEARWGYFSQKDGERHLFDLCEECYGNLTGGFLIPVTVEDETEFL
ncbi:MAG: hypothetical protein IKV59_03770 [Lachnospiraceae bacterium]|nr:hypothetical protein [Lachnospiraceae bacterium]